MNDVTEAARLSSEGRLASIVADIEDLRSIRRTIHAHPETGFEEFRTARLIADALRAAGLDEVHEGIAGTGVVGVLRASQAASRAGSQSTFRPGSGTAAQSSVHERPRAIALRADMDALHIDEQNTFEHRSRIPGRMHACGHDGHATMLLGAARHLALHRDFAGTLYFVFQPAEEHLGGAKAMMSDGLFERFPCDAIYGMHVRPGFPAGHFCTRRGAVLAASDRWRVTFTGSGGHGGAGAHAATDPTLAVGAFLQGVHSIVARNVPANDTAVVSVGHLAAGDAGSPNVIPASAIVVGTARSYTAQVRSIIETRLRALSDGIASAHGCGARVDYERGYPALVNTPRETDVAVEAAMAVAGASGVDSDMQPRTSSDDFAFYLEERPGAFMMIGNGAAADGTFHGVHTPRFDFNDDIIETGVRYWIALARTGSGLAQP